LIPDLRIVPPAEPDAKQAVIERVKRMPRPPGTIQCPKCGSRSIMTVVNGSWIDGQGKYHRGTVCDDRVCYDCHRKGIWTPMMPSPPKLAKEPKPRRTKPKAVK
jgi:hypothetical protein